MDRPFFLLPNRFAVATRLNLPDVQRVCDAAAMSVEILYCPV